MFGEIKFIYISRSVHKDAFGCAKVRPSGDSAIVLLQ